VIPGDQKNNVVAGEKFKNPGTYGVFLPITRGKRNL